MVEVAEGEVIFRGGKLEVMLLVDIEQLVAVAVRSAPGWGTASPHVHARHAEALYVFEGEVTLQLEDRAHSLGPETWAFVPHGITHMFEVTGEREARFLVLHAPGSGFGGYIRGQTTGFDQLSPLDAVTRDPELVVIRRAGGDEGERITDRPERRLTVLLDAGEIAITESHYGPGQRGAPPHVHREHADAFFVLEGELAFHLRDGSRALPAGTLAVAPPGVVHGFDNDDDSSARYFNFHVPSLGFVDYLRGNKPDFDQHEPPEDDGADPSAVVVARLPE
jgi:quercetin dioxygenase-like cupin family protein